MVLSAGLANMVGQNITNYPELMAGGAIAAMPMILLSVSYTHLDVYKRQAT